MLTFVTLTKTVHVSLYRITAVLAVYESGNTLPHGKILGTSISVDLNRFDCLLADFSQENARKIHFIIDTPCEFIGFVFFLCNIFLISYNFFMCINV